MGRNKKRKLELQQQRKEGEELPSTSYPLPLSTTTYASASELRNWAELPELALHSILTRLLTSNPDLPDFLSFSSVCRSWKSTSSTSPTSFPPLLLLPGNPNRLPRRYRPSFCRLQTLLTRRTFQSKIPPETLTLTCLGYSNGRLIFLSDRNPLLADVFTGELTRIRPPPGDYCILLALFANQNLCLLTSKSLLSYRPKTNSWSSLVNTDPSGYIVSLAFHGGKLFGFDSMSRLIVVELGGAEDRTFIGGWKLMEVAAPVEQPGEPADLFSTFGHRLVECDGELLLLRLNKLMQLPPIRCRITVYRLDFERSVWVRKESLGNWCMFLDTVGHCPVSCPNPARWGGRSKCIYFAGKGPNEWGVVPLDEDFLSNVGIESPECGFNPNYLRQWPIPIWVYPSMLFSGTSN